MRIVTGLDEWLGPWMTARQQDAVWVPGSGHTIGLLNDAGDPLCVVLYDGFNGANIMMHVAAVPGKRWLNRDYLCYCFRYPFEQLKVKRVTGLVAASNTAARKFDENLGFTLEATLEEAHPDGDLLVYKMTREQCRWLTLKEPKNGKVQRTSST